MNRRRENCIFFKMKKKACRGGFWEMECILDIRSAYRDELCYSFDDKREDEQKCWNYSVIMNQMNEINLLLHIAGLVLVKNNKNNELIVKSRD